MTEKSSNELAQPRSSRFGVHLQWDGIALWLPLLGISPLLYVQALNMWDRPHLQFFPVTLGVVGWIAFSELPKDGKLDGGFRFWSAATILAISYALIPTAFLFYSPWLAQLSLIAAFLSWCLVRLYATPLTRIVAIWGLLLSTLPLPFSIDERLISQLQSWSSKACASALDALQVANLLQGNILHIEQHTLFVEEACSGVTSLYSLISLALIFVVTQRRSFFHSALILLATPLVAINGNILRLILIALGFEWWDVDLTKGYEHDAVGLIAFLSSAVALVSFNQLISQFFAPIPKLKSQKSLFRRCYNSIVGWPFQTINLGENVLNSDLEVVKNAQSLPKTLVRRFSIGPIPLFPVFCVMFALFFIPVYQIVRLREKSIGANVPPEFASQFPKQELFPSKLSSGWEVTGFNETTRNLRSNIGQHSHSWRLFKKEKAVILSLDFAFIGWHSLDNCYRSSGWKVSKVDKKPAVANEWSWTECEMENDFGSMGYLWYSLFDENGEPYNQAVDGKSAEFRFPRQTAIESLLERSDGFSPVTFQVQIFIESGQHLSDDDRLELTSLYLELRELIRVGSMPALKRLKGR